MKSKIGFDLGSINSRLFWNKEEVLQSKNNLTLAYEEEILAFLQSHINAQKLKYAIDGVGIALACSMKPCKGDRQILSTSITAIINAVPVECVAVAGGVAKAKAILMDPLKERIYRGDWFDPDLAPLIDVINLSEFSVAHGAKSYALRQQHPQTGTAGF